MEFSVSTTRNYYGEPVGDQFTVSASVSGSCGATGGIEIRDPNYYYLSLRAEADYYASGQTTISLYGNIQ